MYDTSNPKIIAELQRIAGNGQGLLDPMMVVEAARHPKSCLHKMFEWDDDAAARAYRLQQARELIRATVRFVEINGDKRPVRAFVSLTSDREVGGASYRDVVAVIADKDMRRQMLEDALTELGNFERKYSHLKELAGVFTASKTARATLIQAWAA